MHAFFHFRNVITPRPISTLGLTALWPISVSRDDNSPDMEKDMHALIYKYQHIKILNSKLVIEMM